MQSDLFIVLYKWIEVEKDEYENSDHLKEWKLKTDANEDNRTDYYLYPDALVCEQSKEDSQDYGVKGKPFFATLHKFEGNNPFEEEYFETKEEAFEWCENRFALTKIGG